MSAALACGIASADTGDEIPLNSRSVTLSSSSARLIRTSLTPNEVVINLPIGMQNRVCTQYAQVPHTGQNGFQCGYDQFVRRVCRDLPRQCRFDPRLKREVCAPQGRECRNESFSQARFCTWFENECVRTEIAQSDRRRKVTLKFKHMAGLADGESETYELSGVQKRLDGSEAIFSLTPISTKRPVRIKARDGLFTGFKDVILVKGE